MEKHLPLGQPSTLRGPPAAAPQHPGPEQPKGGAAAAAGRRGKPGRGGAGAGGARGGVAAPFLPGGLERWAGAFRRADRSEVLEAE